MNCNEATVPNGALPVLALSQEHGVPPVQDRWEELLKRPCRIDINRSSGYANQRRFYEASRRSCRIDPLDAVSRFWGGAADARPHRRGDRPRHLDRTLCTPQRVLTAYS